MSSPKNKSNCVRVMQTLKSFKKMIFHLDVFHIFLLGEFLLAHSTQSSAGTRMSRMVITEGVTILHPSCNERVPNLTDTFHLFAGI